jgi:chromosome segregation ATPase
MPCARAKRPCYWGDNAPQRRPRAAKPEKVERVEKGAESSDDGGEFMPVLEKLGRELLREMKGIREELADLRRGSADMWEEFQEFRKDVKGIRASSHRSSLELTGIHRQLQDLESCMDPDYKVVESEGSEMEVDREEVRKELGDLQRAETSESTEKSESTGEGSK